VGQQVAVGDRVRVDHDDAVGRVAQQAVHRPAQRVALAQPLLVTARHHLGAGPGGQPGGAVGAVVGDDDHAIPVARI
jgi:hypothetical protein